MESISNVKFAAKPQVEADRLMEKISEIDLESIAFKLVYSEDGDGWTVEKTDKLIERYRAFLALNELYKDADFSIVPSKEIDEVWHTHILDTAKYREDCEKVFGRFIDHFPYFGLRGNEDEKNLHEAYEVSRALYKLHFDFDPRSSVNENSADCGSGSCSPSCNAQECGGCATPPDCDSGNEKSMNVMKPNIRPRLIR